MSAADDDRLITKTAAAEFLGINVRRLNRFITAGAVPTVLDPETGAVLFTRSMLRAWMERTGQLVAERGAA